MAFGQTASILIPSNPTLTEKFAAEELSKYLQKITSEKTEVTTTKKDGDFTFSIANNLEPELNLGQEDYCVKTVENGVVLSGGGDRGTLYAVYEFLERLGCRWYFMDEADEIVPAMSIADVLKIAGGNLDIVEKPDFSIRINRIETYDLGPRGNPVSKAIMSKEQMTDRMDWTGKNRMNMFEYGIDHNNDCYDNWSGYAAVFDEMKKRSITIGAGGHMFFKFMPPETFKEHPDWFALIKGERVAQSQFCTSNKDACQFYVDNMLKFLNENPEIKYFGPWPHDMGNWCECDLCKDKTIGDRYLELSNTVYKLLKEKRPDVTFTHFPYGTFMHPPQNAKPERGMNITLCTWGRNFDTTINDPKTWGIFRDALAGWSEISKEYNNTFIYHEKYLRHLGFGFHPLPLKILKPEIKYLHSVGLDGFELPTGYFGRRTKSLNAYVTCKLIWDIDTDVDAVVDDYFDKMYGDLSPIMRKAYEEVELAQMDLRYFRQFNMLIWDFKGVLDAYAAKENAYALNTLKHLEYGCEYTEQALGACDDEKIKERIEKFQKSLKYLQVEWQGRQLMTKASGYIEGLKQAKDAAEYNAKLSLAEQCIDQADKFVKERDTIATANPGCGLYWDAIWNEQQGTFKSAHLKDWRMLFDEKRKEGLKK